MTDYHVRPGQEPLPEEECWWCGGAWQADEEPLLVAGNCGDCGDSCTEMLWVHPSCDAEARAGQAADRVLLRALADALQLN